MTSRKVTAGDNLWSSHKDICGVIVCLLVNILKIYSEERKDKYKNENSMELPLYVLVINLSNSCHKRS